MTADMRFRVWLLRGDQETAFTLVDTPADSVTWALQHQRDLLDEGWRLTF